MTAPPGARPDGNGIFRRTWVLLVPIRVADQVLLSLGSTRWFALVASYSGSWKPGDQKVFLKRLPQPQVAAIPSVAPNGGQTTKVAPVVFILYPYVLAWARLGPNRGRNPQRQLRVAQVVCMPTPGAGVSEAWDAVCGFDPTY